MLYVVRHRNRGHFKASAPIAAALAVEAAVALAAAGCSVTATDDRGAPVDLEDLAEQVRRAAQG
ncbi:MAG: hypothetical protein AB1942_14235 [Pseudomonadota bacterium]